jgi:hypothetical protein
MPKKESKRLRNKRAIILDDKELMELCNSKDPFIGNNKSLPKLKTKKEMVEIAKILLSKVDNL